MRCTNEGYECDMRIIIWKIIDFLLGNKIKDYQDKFVLVNALIRKSVISDIPFLSGTIERYIGDVGDIKIEKELLKDLQQINYEAKY